MIRVSVVVPVFNPGPYIESCVESLARQSMPTEEFEAIFVDDGSTDETPGYLDELAGRRDNVRVIHQENSGWPGKPRNVGIDAAHGEYVFFCDNDDWLGDEALERMYDYAKLNDADIVVGKMAGLNRSVPQSLFRRSRPTATLTTAPLMDSLTPHKLFRRAFLNRHNIQFPEGRRRLEDHVFVVKAYLLADTISVYSDYTCYYHIARKDASNAGFRAVDWSGYFANLSEALDLVVAHTDPGDLRDTIYRRWLQNEMVNRLRGQQFRRLDPDEAERLFAAAHSTAARYFGEGVVRRLPLASQAVARALIVGDRAAVSRLAEAESHWQLDAKLLQFGWDPSRLQVSGVATFLDTSRPAGSDITTSELFAGLSEQDRATALTKTSVTLDVTERRTGQRWLLPCSAHRHGSVVTFTADVEADLAAAGQPLPDGIWDFFVECALLGVRRRRRLVATEERNHADPQLRPNQLGSQTAAYLTKNNYGLTLDVGLLYHPELRIAYQSEDRLTDVIVVDEAVESSGGQASTTRAKSRLASRAIGALDMGVERLRGRRRR